MFNNDESTLSTFSLQKKTVIKIQVCFMHWSVWNTLPVGTMWHKLIMHKNLQYGCTWCESFASAKRLSWIGMSERFVLKLPYYLFILEVPHVKCRGTNLTSFFKIFWTWYLYGNVDSVNVNLSIYFFLKTTKHPLDLRINKKLLKTNKWISN